MPDASVNIGGDASGAIAAVAAAQGAIDALHGKTVNVEVNVRQNGGGVGGLASDLGRAGEAADRAGRAGRGMGDSFDRAGRSAHGMGDHVGHAADQAGRLRDHLDAVNGIMSGGAPSSTARANGMRSLANEAERARGSIGGVGSESSRSLGTAGAGAIRAGESMRQLGAGASSARQFMAGASGAAQQVSRDLVPMAQGADGAYRAVSRMASAGKDVEKFAGSMRTIDAVGRSIDGGGSGGGGGLGGLMNKLGGLPDVAMPSMMAMKGVGLTAGVAALGMGALSAAVAGVGLAGVAEDFAHNSQLMHAGSEAVHGFNKEFSAMKGATSAAGMPAMANVASSMKGVGHELAAIGAANIGPVLNDVASLGNQATQAMTKLAPSIGPAMQGLTALGGAVLGAFGDSGPAVTSFANTVTQNAAGLQALTSSAINTAGAVGNATVDALGGAGQFDSGVGSPSGKPPGSAIDTNGSHSLGGMLQSFGMLAMGGPLVAAFGAAGAAGELISGPSGGGGAAPPVAPGQFDPSKPFSGQLPDGKGGFTPGTGDGGAAKPPAPKGGGGGGGYQPSPDAGRFSGMPAADIMSQQRADAGMPPVGAPHYSGVGPRGPGQSVGAMPPSIASGLGGGMPQGSNTAALGSLMTGGMQSQIANSGGGTGAAMVQHIQKAVSTAAPAAAAGGGAIGGGISGGMAQGSNSSMTVVDTVMVRHVKHLIEIAAGALGIHSPSKEFDYLGRMTGQGFGQGIERSSDHTFGAMDGMLSGAKAQARKTSMDYDGSTGETVTVKKPAKSDDAAGYDDYKQAVADQKAAADRKASFGTQQGVYKPGSEGWWSAHDNRAGQLQAGREGRQRSAIGGMTHDERAQQLRQGVADRREIALANLGVKGHVDPRRDPNSAMNNANPFKGQSGDPKGMTAEMRSQGLNAVVNPFSQMFHKAGEMSAQGLSAGMTAHVSKVQAAGANLAGAGHGGYKKKDKQSSPSAVWADMAGNSVAGAVGGMNAGGPALAGAAASMAGSMQAAAVGPMSDSSLQLGYTWSRNVITGAQSGLKTANFQGGTPDVDNEQVRTALAGIGALGGYGGASVYKTPSRSFSGSDATTAAINALAQAVASQPLAVTVNLDSQFVDQKIVEGGNQIFEVLYNALVGANG